jgi:hypothetical protein
MNSSVRAVLFVNIGWADKYDGREDIRGNHEFLRDHADDNSEYTAFLRDHDGVYSCGIGHGSIKVPDLDIVFVARNPETGGHYAVGLYLDAWWTADDDSERKPWIRAHSKTAHLIPTKSRAKVAWPGFRDMRRWARRVVGKGLEHKHLYRSYQELLAVLQRPKVRVPTPVALPRNTLKRGRGRSQDSPLAPRGDADLLVLKAGATEIRQQLHNRMTNALGKLCVRRGLSVRQGNSATSLYDALVRQFDGSRHDLLIEVKTSTESAVCRMAVGQLFDYRRSLPNRDSTDLAVLFPEPPGRHARAFLADVGVKALWFTPTQLGILGDWSL